jgi:hypothetical protein
VTPFRSDPRLARHPLKADPQLPSDTAAAQTWNRVGGLLTRAGRMAGLEPAAMLAVWMVECGGLSFRRGQPVLRFEPHVFFARWGTENEEAFDRHFRFGSRNGTDGARWQNHGLREKAEAEWQRFHGDQAAEYRALRLAAKLGGEETACQCASFGGPQIMGFNHAAVGYGSAGEMFRAFGRSERWQVLAFFDFCAAKDILGALAAHDWAAFARVYNGPGNAETYASKIGEAYAAARQLLEGCD